MLTPEYLNSFSSGYLGMCDVLNEQIMWRIRLYISRMLKEVTASPRLLKALDKASSEIRKREGC